ncbi:hypothetical protein BGX28_000213, partial [Mortierella sp. GBA30]
MYKTGDLARCLSDGNIVYLGRNDHQVKIRGFRIELGEIQARLNEHPLVSEAAVFAMGEEANKRLVAYVIPKSDDSDVEDTDGDKPQLALALRSYLGERLPEYMVPAAFVKLSAFPLTSNGKIDRRALPDPGGDAFAREAFEEPHGEVEVALAAIWADLLHLERVSRHDSFFALGGHSLLAVRMMNRVAALGTNVPLSTLFVSPCLSDFADEIKRHKEHGSDLLPPIERLARSDVLPLSFAQQRMWFLAQLDGVSDVYHVPLAIRLHGHLNRGAWKLAVDDLIERHEALRTAFVAVNGEPHVRLLPPEGLRIGYIDLRDKIDIEEQLAMIADKEVHTSFDLAKGPPIRVTLVQMADNEHVLLLIQHHIVADGWSLAILARELSQLYSAHCRGESNPLLPLTVQYPDYAAWQRKWFSEDRLKIQAEYWRTTLAGVPVLIDLPTDHPRPPQQSYAGSRVPIAFDAELTAGLKRLSQDHGVTLFMTILTAWSVVLSRLSGQDDIVIGTPSANRGYHEVEPLIGLFVNTLALRVDLSGKLTTRDLLERVRRCTLAAHSHQDLPFEQVVEIVQPPRKMDHTPLFQVMLAWQNNEASEWSLQDVQATNYALDYKISKFDLELGIYETDDGIVGSLRYATSLFHRATIEKHLGYLTTMLQEMVSDADQLVGSIDILSPAERSLLLHTWNVTKEEHPNDLCLHHLFEQQVTRAPESVALVHESKCLTYSELNARANRLAHHLIHLGVRPDAPVGICVERSLGLIIGILAILKSGGAYVPLDPAHASERLLDILSDASPSVVLADKSGTNVLGNAGLSSRTIVDPNAYLEGSVANPHVHSLGMHNLAYLIYTSGSTGKPKGVMVEHAQVTRLFSATYNWFRFNRSDIWCLVHSYGFDVSVWEMWGALRNGGKLMVVSQDTVRSPQELYRFVREHGVTVLNLTPSTFKPIIDIQAAGGLKDQLRYVILAGEALVPAILRPWYASHAVDSPRIVNMYGPTETIHATYRPMALEDCDQSHSIIGVRLPDLRTYVLDGKGQPLPLGAVGELFIGGAGVARGYLNKPELTDERFLPDPFAGVAKARMYKTGDLVRYLSDGNLVYLGRNDHQVKVRGFRIELGEIEARLNEHPEVSEALVITLGEGSEKRLIAYVVAKSDDPQLALTLRSHLKKRLPEYMVPAAFVRLDAFPLNPNGKLDRLALPIPGEHSLAREAYEAPEGEIEVALASIWTDLLRLERVSRHDSFFALGGHSLLAVRMMNRITSLGANLPLAAIFSSPCLSALAEEVKRFFGQDYDILPSVERIPRSEALPLSFAQQRMWFLAQLDEVSDVYHIPLAIRLHGYLDRDSWQLAINNLIERHEALRTVFVSIKGEPHARVLTSKGLPIGHIDLRGRVDIEKQLVSLAAKEARASFDLAQGPLIRVTLVQIANNEHLLLLTQHHIVADGWSLAILARELSQLYSAHCRGESNPLLPLTVQYPDYAAWQRKWFSEDRLKIQAEYWRTTLAGVPVLIDLPTDHPRPPQQSYAGSRVPIAFDAELTAGLKRLSQEHG